MMNEEIQLKLFEILCVCALISLIHLFLSKHVALNLVQSTMGCWFISTPLFWHQSEGLVLHQSCCSLSEGFGSHCGPVWLKKGKESEKLVVVLSVLNANRWLVVNLSHWHLAGNWMLGHLCTTGCLWQAMKSITKLPHNILQWKISVS